MKILSKVTKHVVLKNYDPSPETSFGIIRGMQESLTFLKNDFAGRIQSLKDVHKPDTRYGTRWFKFSRDAA